jgi:hypothetical protein
MGIFSRKAILKNPLVLVFCNRYLLENPEIIKDLRKEFYEDMCLDLLREK